MDADADVLVIGAGPAGASSAILLRLAGWRVILVEQSVYPRQKVCGECITAGSLMLLDKLGVGAAVRDRAGPELQQVAWMSGASTLVAALPPCLDAPYRYGRALGRDHLDLLLVDRARELGVTVVQPAKVRAVHEGQEQFSCEIEPSDSSRTHGIVRLGTTITHRVRIVIDAHGSWEAGPRESGVDAVRAPRRGSDLFGFKASFRNTLLPPGLLPVLAFSGGYGGMVVADGGRLTLAGCIRRDTLGRWRARSPGTSAGAAFEQYLRQSCLGVREMLDGAEPTSSWASVGPLRPGFRLAKIRGSFRVGNAAGETHPLIGEGMTMALQSAFLLISLLVEQPARQIDARRSFEIHRAYGAAWRSAFAHRLRLAAAYAHIAMRPALGMTARVLFRHWPPLLTHAANLAGKARPPPDQSLAWENRS
jgi:menaquinone-9 beta-reductase